MSRFTNTTTSSTHHLQLPTTSQPPPSSYRATGGIRNSLKKIPSSFFGEKAKRENKFTIHMDDTTAAPAPFSRSLKTAAVPAFLSNSNNASDTRQDKEKSKLQKKPKTRKGLGEIFGWSNSNSNSNNSQPQPIISPPIISAPSALMPSPPRVSKENANTNVIMPRQARRTSSKSSIPGLAGWTSLRPPAETPAKARPSMAADPFGRTDVGAERVNQIQECGELYERRGSVSSGKAFSAKTMESGSADSHIDRYNRNSVSSGKALSSKTFGTMDRPGSITSSKAISTKTVDSDYTIRYHGQAEIRRAKHMSPVPARATLVELPSRANSTIRRPSDPIPSPRQLAVSANSSVADRSIVPCPPVTKAIKKEKTKSRVWGLLGIKSRKSKDVLADKATAPATTAAASPARQTIKATIKDALTPSKVPKRVSSIHALKPNATIKSTSQSTRRSAVPWPPSLHITKPSADVSAGPLSGSTMASAYDRSTDFGPDSNGISGLLSNRMPKRKSLNGLFGLSIKEAEAFEQRHQYQEVSTYDATPEHTHTIEEIKPRSNTLRRVASATDKLVDLVTAFEFSPASRRTITPMESLSSIAETIKDAHDGSPTPMRKVKSAVLSIRGVSPMRQGPNVSPLKLALHRKQVEAPVKAILSKKSSHNIFAPAEAVEKIATPATGPKVKDSEDNFATVRGGNARGFLQPPVRASEVSAETAARSSPFLPPPTTAAPIAGLPPPPRPNRRNVFAPPSPEITAVKLAGLDFSDETVGMPKLRPISCQSAFTDRVEHDVPQDLRDLFQYADFTSSVAASPMAGLPQPPPSDRRPTSARRRRNPPPAALPACPLAPFDEKEQKYLTVDASPERAMQSESARGSTLSEFDFDYEFAKLNKGTQRASFVEALQKAQDNCSQASHDLPPLPPLPCPPARFGEYRNSQFDDAASERGSKSSTDTVVVATATAARNRFMGTFAFQQHASKARGSHSPGNEPQPQAAERDIIPDIEIEYASQCLDSEETETEVEPEHEHELGQQQGNERFQHALEDYTMELAPPPQRRYHQRDESGVSIATMSSIGEVIETGIAGDYTNYFDVEFARDNAKKLGTARPQPTAQAQSSQMHSRQSSHASTTSAHGRGHRRGHSRNTSIASIGSIDGLELPSRWAAGPPVTLHNLKRSSYISKHRHSGSSFDAGTGRSDWAAEHRRNFSDESVMSNLSASRIARPGLGDRMFQLDGGVQLTSITASPLDRVDDQSSESETEEEEEGEEEERQHAMLNVSKSTYYTAYDGQEASFHTALDTSLNDRDRDRDSNYGDGDMSSSEDQHKSRPVSTSSATSSVQSSSGDSIFGPNPTRMKGNFLLRPISVITTDSSSNEEDTFVNVMKAQGKGQMAMKRAPSCIEAQGEETTTPVNVARPRKPRSDRRRHVQLVLESDLETPGLTSPSASEASSRMSLETRLSEGPPLRAFFAGHRRQRSSAAVQPQATIKEEPSAANLNQSPLEWKEVGTVRSYLDWEREADVECRKVRTQWSDSDESKLALQDFKAPTSQQAIVEFLAQSTLAYGPMKQQHLPKAHRRKSSLSEARASLSPYGHPLARPPVHGGMQHFAPPQVQVQIPRKAEGQAQKPRMSLTTKFERNNSNSATSSHFPSDDEPVSQPTSAIFAQFTRDTPPTPPPVLMELPNMSPFKMNMGTGYSFDPKKGSKDKEAKRQRVDSEVRRQALGWGKRRSSDGPTKVIAAVEPVPRIPLAFLRPKAGLRDKENIRPTASPTKKAMPVAGGLGNGNLNPKRPTRRVPRLASVPKGLRA